MWNGIELRKYGLVSILSKMSNYSLPSRYSVLSELGSGGMGIVLKAQDANLNKLVAIKILNKEFIDQDPKYLQRFQNEAKAAGKLKNPGLITVLDFGVTEDNFPYLVMDLYEGKTLKDLISEEGKLSLSNTLAILSQITLAMDHAHNNFVIHRDLKPANLLIVENDGEESIKVVDFGIAKAFETKGEMQLLTQSGDLLGTPTYMSPEQISGDKISELTDVYSLGCIVFECLTGEVPFSGETAMETMNLHLTKAPLSISEFGNFPNSLIGLVAKMLEKNPQERIKSMAEINSEVASILDNIDENTEKVNDIEMQNGKADSQSVFMILASLILFVSVAATILGVLFYNVDNQNVEKKNKPLVDDVFDSPFDAKMPLPQFRRYIASEKRKQAGCNLKNFILDKEMMVEVSKLGFYSLKLDGAKILYPESFNLLANDKTGAIVLNRAKNVDDSIISQLSSFKNLKVLGISDTDITKEGVVEILNSIKLQNIELDKLDIDDSVLSVISENQKQLEKLQIQYCNQITDNGIENLKDIKGLLVLDITGCYLVTDKSMKTIADNFSLFQLLVAGDSLISDTGVGYLKMKTLKKLDISGCEKVTIKSLKKIAADLDLVELIASGDYMFTQEAIDYLKGMKNLQNLKVIAGDNISQALKDRLRASLSGIKVRVERR